MTQDRRITDKLPGRPLQWEEAGASVPAAGQAGLATDYVLMPKRLTAENGAKSALMGEFKESIEVACPDCHDEDEDYDCATCENMGCVSQDVTVGWDTIKDIYARAVELLAAPVAADTEQASWRKALHDLRMAVSYRAACVIEGNQEKIAFADEKLWAAHEAAGAVLATPADAPTQQETDEHSVIALLPEIHAKLIEAFKEGARHGVAGTGLDCEASAAAVRIMHAWDLPDATPADAGAGLTDAMIVDALHSCGIDTRPSKYGFDALQVDSTSVPSLRAVFDKLLARLSTRGAPVTASHPSQIATTDAARAFLRKWMNANFLADKTFHDYIEFSLAGDFAFQLAKAIEAKEVRQSPAPVTAEPVASRDPDHDHFTMPQVQAIINTIKPGDGWGGDDWDFALANAVARHIAAPAPADRDAIRDQALGKEPE